MWPGIIAVIALLIFVIYFIVILFPVFIEVAINGFILWIVLTRGYADIIKEHKERYYAYGAIAGVVSLFIIRFNGMSNIWWVTVFCAVTFAAAQAIMFFEKK